MKSFTEHLPNLGAVTVTQPASHALGRRAVKQGEGHSVENRTQNQGP